MPDSLQRLFLKSPNRVPSIVLAGILAGCATLSPTFVPEVSDAPVQRLFLQQVTDASVMVRWRGGGDQVCYTHGADFARSHACVAASIDSSADGSSHKMAMLVGLTPDRRYFYNVNGYGSASQYFLTAPSPGQLPDDGNTRMWIIGDSGSETAIVPEAFGGSGKPEMSGKAQQVRDGFRAYVAATGGEAPDLFLLLGDNAYMEGSDPQWQGAFFDIYPDVMNTAAVWPTIGNHEMGAAYIDVAGGITAGGVSTSADPDTWADLDDSTVDRGMPYLHIFSLPTRGEAGGVPSGTEQYYSFDYANVHVVSLDSQVTARDEVLRAAMKDWLILDLSANTADWTIVIFHHPVYSKSSHDSDTEAASKYGIDLPMINIRREFTAVFEDYGVDLIYGGHSHAYERSWYLHGHRGDSDTFDPALHAELNEQGLPASGFGDEAYTQIARNGDDDKVVYTVAGSSGYMSTGAGKLDHPAHYRFPDGKHGLALMGSVVVDARRNTLTASFIDPSGTVHDQVIITR